MIPILYSSFKSPRPMEMIDAAIVERLRLNGYVLDKPHFSLAVAVAVTESRTLHVMHCSTQ